MALNPPDVLILGPEWPERALLRAELIEAGLDVAAIDRWPIPRLYLNPDMKPRTVVVDLQGLADPRAVLDQLRLSLRPDCVVVISALGTIPIDEIRQMGYRVVARPISIRDVVTTVTNVLQDHSPEKMG